MDYRFRTKAGICIITQDHVYLVRKGVRGALAELIFGDSIDRALAIYGILGAVMLADGCWDIAQGDIFTGMLLTAVGVLLLRRAVIGRNFSAAPIVERSAIRAIEAHPPRPPAKRGYFLLSFEEYGRMRKRVILLPGSWDRGREEYSLAVEALKQACLLVRIGDPMTMLDSNDAAELAKILCVRDKDGRPALRVGLVVTMFFADSWTRPVREAVAAAAEEYIHQFRSYLYWTKHPKTRNMHTIDSKQVPFPQVWLPQHDDAEDWSFNFCGGETDDVASEFQVSAMGSNARVKGTGYFQMYLPLAWFAEHPGTFQEFVFSFAKRLHPLSGYAGIGVQEPLSLDAREFSVATVRQIAERFPGLEIESPHMDTIHVGEGIKGVNWLTVLGDHWVQEIGGLDYLRIRLGDDFKLTPYDGGVMIQAGPKPQIGDVTTNRWPQHYVTLAKVLKPIQIKEHYGFHTGDGLGSRRMDSKASEAWLFRFDGKAS